MHLKIIAASLLLLAMGAGCTNPRRERTTEDRLAAQHEFENAYIDVDDPD